MELERIKTIVLVFLITLSLVLSIFLWNSAPRLDNLKPSDYVAPQPIGHKYEVTDMIRPAALVFHTGDGRHFKTDIGSALYKKMMPEMDKWHFSEFTEVKLTKEQWETVANKKKGLEIVYKHEIPADIASELFSLRGHIEVEFNSISRMMLYENREKNAVYALFISDEDQRVIQAQASIPIEDMERWVSPQFLAGLSELMLYRAFVENEEEGMRPNRYAFYQPIYLPKGREKANRYRYFYQPLTVQQVLDTLFVDASLTRQVTERDGTMIYTNGSQSVSIPANRTYLLYRYPVHEWEPSKVDRVHYDALNSALSFVNEHGGWTGRYYLESLEKSQSGEEETVAYRFRQYIDSYPLFSEIPDTNVVSLRVSGGTVSELYYPMQQLDLYFERVSVPIMSGVELIKWMEKQRIDKRKVTRIEFGLYTRSKYDFIEMRPVWVIHQRELPPVYVEAEVSASRAEKEAGGTK